jgi:hypothetical protein
MHSPPRLIARIDVSLEIREPHWAARSAWIADWLRRVARVIERGDLPREGRADSAPESTAPP